MFPAPFDYSAPVTIGDALALLSRHGDSAKLLAGGQSLLPMMKLRFAQPAHLVDLRRIPSLAGVRRSDGALVIGAMTTHQEVASSADVRAAAPMLAEAAGQIGDPQVRNCGTIGGSLAHAEATADLPAVVLAAGAELLAVGPRGQRLIAAADFFVDVMTTALEPTEILIEIRIPASLSGSAYAKRAHPASRFAIVGVAAVVHLETAGGTIRSARVATTGLGSRAARAQSVEQALAGKVPDVETIRAAARLISGDVQPREDFQGDAAYKTHLAAIYAERALSAAVTRAQTAA